MRRPSRRRTWLATFAAAATVTTGLGAHDFWIEPSTFEVRAGELVQIHLRVGERFAGEPVPRDESRIERFVLVGPSGERRVIGRDGMDPAGLLRLNAPGIWFVGYRSTPSAVELSATLFEQYLREEGLERIIEERASRNESRSPGHERFSRSVKTVLRTTGSAGSNGYDRVLGLTLEFVLEADPAAVPDARVPVRLLHDGKPLAGALVVAFRRAPGHQGEAREASRGRTDSAGRIVIPVGAGVWLVKAVHMERAEPDSTVQWESVWTSITFEISGRSRAESPSRPSARR